MVLPEGFILPPWYILLPLVVLLVGNVALLLVIKPPVLDKTVLAFAPWMILGATLHVLYKIEAFPAPIDVLFSAPTVYVTTAIVGLAVWIGGTFLYAAGLQRSAERFLGLVGTILCLAFVGVSLYIGWVLGDFDPITAFWPVVAVIVTGIIAALAWFALSLWFTEVAAITSVTGAFVVVSHTLDGVSTAIGFDFLGAGEEVPASRFILETAASLPTAEYIGAGWLFVLVKVALALVVVGLFTSYVDEQPDQARVLLAIVAAVGLGPGFHNLLLFAVGF